MNENPLKQYYRQPALYLKLPTLGMWYDPSDVKLTDEKEVAIYGLSAIDDIMLNTPDAMLNGQALENVVKNCVPSVSSVKHLLVPDLEAIFLGMKIATNSGKYEIERKCPKCGTENNFEVNCNSLLDTMSYIEDSDTVLEFDRDLIVKVKPYSFEMRQLFMQHQFEEDRVLKAIDNKNTNIDDLEKAHILAESVKKLANITFKLVSLSIVSIHLIKQNVTVTDQTQIAEWLVNIGKNQADAVIKAVNALNVVGPNRTVNPICTNPECNHTWSENLNFDPVSFFGKR